MMSFQCNVIITLQNIYILGYAIVSDEVNKFHNVHSLKSISKNEYTVWNISTKNDHTRN